MSMYLILSKTFAITLNDNVPTIIGNSDEKCNSFLKYCSRYCACCVI